MSAVQAVDLTGSKNIDEPHGASDSRYVRIFGGMASMSAASDLAKTPCGLHDPQPQGNSVQGLVSR